jgi:MYXO-CTERM domain-containing protein
MGTTGALCFGYAELEPSANYEWAVRYIDAFDSEFSHHFGAWRRFSTSEGPSRSTPLGHVGAKVVSYEMHEDPPCGDWSSGTLEFDAYLLEEPVVANVAGLTPYYATHAVVLEPGSVAQMFVWNVEGCKETELFDELGARTVLAEVCFRKDSSASDSGTSQGESEVSGSGSDTDLNSESVGRTRRGAGCTAAIGETENSTWGLLMLLGFGALLRIRRSRFERSASLHVGSAKKRVGPAF